MKEQLQIRTYEDAARYLSGLGIPERQDEKLTVRRTARLTNATGYLGVKRHRTRYEAEIRSAFSGKFLPLGSYANGAEAALAFDQAARYLRGRKTFLNFPTPEEEADPTRFLCVHGHDVRVAGTNKKGDCIECARTGSRLAQRERTGYLPAPIRDKQGHYTCKQGHNTQLTGLSGQGFCAECRRRNKAEGRARRRADRAKAKREAVAA
jgi:hypothetical protein